MTSDQLMAEIKAIIAQGGDVDMMARKITVLMLREATGRARGAAMDSSFRDGGHGDDR